jgi:two-component system aerobic respiration control sensor histidine kinase ArcB
MKTDLDMNLAFADTEQLREALAKKEQMYAELLSVVDNLPTSIYWKDRNGVYHGRNKKSVETDAKHGFTWHRDEVVGKSDFYLFEPEIARQFSKNDRIVVETGEELQQEEEAFFSNGEKCVQLSIKRPWRNKEGEIIGVIGNTFDITYLKKIESELRLAKEQAEIADRLKTQFIRDMEHDIRTPLSGIIGLAEILTGEIQEPIWKEYLADIRQCGEELMEYSDRILDFAKREAKEYEIVESNINVRELLHKVISLEKPPAEYKKLKVNIHIDEHVPPIVYGDKDRLYRVLLNLISNAIKFTQEGGVSIRVTPGPIQDNSVSLSFVIEDTGVGIPHEQSGLIFDKFFRQYASNNGRFKGIGLGLYLVKKFVTQMQGAISVSSRLNHGTTFTVILPFKIDNKDDNQ